MSAISKYLNMNREQLDEAITSQKRKIESCKETIKLLERLKMALPENPENKERRDSI